MIKIAEKRFEMRNNVTLVCSLVSVVRVCVCM